MSPYVDCCSLQWEASLIKAENNVYLRFASCQFSWTTVASSLLGPMTSQPCFCSLTELKVPGMNFLLWRRPHIHLEWLILMINYPHNSCSTTAPWTHLARQVEVVVYKGLQMGKTGDAFALLSVHMAVKAHQQGGGFQPTCLEFSVSCSQGVWCH